MGASLSQKKEKNDAYEQVDRQYENEIWTEGHLVHRWFNFSPNFCDGGGQVVSTSTDRSSQINHCIFCLVLRAYNFGMGHQLDLLIDEKKIYNFIL